MEAIDWDMVRRVALGAVIFVGAVGGLAWFAERMRAEVDARTAAWGGEE